MSSPSSPRCFRCLKTPAELAEYRDMASDEDPPCTPDTVCRRYEGTFNRDANTFCCTACYIAIGQPSSERGWIAPAIGGVAVTRKEPDLDNRP